jgi:hypothetical protein
MEGRMLKITGYIVMAILLMATAGCSTGGQYGAVHKNLEIDRMFQSGKIPAGYHYYYDGVELEPLSILGVRKDYTLSSRFWTEIDLTDKQMKDWRAFFRRSINWSDDRSHRRISYDGYSIKNPQGEPVAILYSRYDWTVVEFPGEGLIRVHPPQPMFQGRTGSFFRTSED